MKVTQCLIEAVRVGDRFRRDMGDIEALAASISEVGLLQPIVIDADENLVAGERRLRACELLGFTHIPAHVIDLDAIILGEHAENEMRKDFTVSERVAIGRALEELIGERRGRPSADIVENFPQFEGGVKTRDLAAQKAGFGNARTYQQAKSVVESGTPELVAALESGKVSVSAAADVATLPRDQQTEIVARGEKEILEAAKAIRTEKAEAKKAERIAEVQRQAQEIAVSTPVAPSGLFHVISIDPPWPYDDGNSGDTYDPNGRRASNPYPEMSLEQIGALSIPAADDCVLWLWTTHKFMRHSFALLDGWGFEEKAILTWVKSRMGLGRWLRSQSEYCIMAVRGSPVISLTNQTTVLHGPMREHSRKPDEFYSMIEALCHGRKLDFFSRETRPGWEQFGNDREKFAS